MPNVDITRCPAHTVIDFNRGQRARLVSVAQDKLVVEAIRAYEIKAASAKENKKV